MNSKSHPTCLVATSIAVHLTGNSKANVDDFYVDTCNILYIKIKIKIISYL